LVSIFYKTSQKMLIKNFARIGGVRIYSLPFLAVVQTDGSYGRKYGPAVAFILKDYAGDKVLSKRIIMPAVRNSTEAEWASVEAGLSAALENNYDNIGIENDNLSVISSLIHSQNRLKHEYARYYRSKIYELASETAWTGVRWIPRKINRADDLFKVDLK
jgi:ribonuclease HI